MHTSQTSKTHQHAVKTMEPELQNSQASRKKEPKENMLLNMVLNIVIPTIILMKLSGEQHLGTKGGIIVALAFPILYGIYDFQRAKKINFFSALGVLSIVLTGGISLLELDPKYIAIKEAAIPALFGIATLISLKTRFPLVRTFLYNDKLMQIDKVDQALEQKNTHEAFEKTLVTASYLIAASFFLSSILNYGLAKILLTAAPGTELYNAQLGKMTALSFPVIAIPATLVLMGAMFYLFKSIKNLTGLSFEDIFINPDENKS